MIQIKLCIAPPDVNISIEVGSGLLFSSHFEPYHSLVFIVDERIEALVRQKVISSCTQKKVLVIPIPSGEAAKTRQVKAAVEDRLLENHIGKDSLLIAVGGGATLDLAGFTAATFYRGLPLIVVPTTLLAMVDASIGGKNGINLYGIKNCLGTVYHPKKILTDVAFLETLSDDEMRSGTVEMMKHAFLSGRESVEQFIKKLSAIKKRDEKVLLDVIAEQVRYKASIVSQSYTDPGLRDLLNFGHTIGHAIETLEAPGCSHGVAVARGLYAESAIAHARGLLSQQEFQELTTALSYLDVPLKMANRFPKAHWERAFLLDKKSNENRPHCVLLNGLGAPLKKEDRYSHPVTLQELHEAIEETLF